MTEPLFLSDNTPEHLPSLIYYKLSKDLYIPEKMIPLVNYSLLVKADSQEVLFGNGNIINPTWVDYYCITGDDTILYQGDLGPIISGENASTKWGAFGYLSAFSWDWRIKYKNTEDYPGAIAALWALSPQNHPIYYQYYKLTKQFVLYCPGASNSTSSAYGKFYVPPHPPEKPVPPYRSIKITKNIPDAEAFKNMRFYSTYNTDTVIKIEDNEYRFSAEGYLYILSKAVLKESITFDVFEITYNVFEEDNLSIGEMGWGWIKKFSYKEVSSTYSKIQKNIYVPEKSSVDLKLCLNIMGPH